MSIDQKKPGEKKITMSEWRDHHLLVLSQIADLKEDSKEIKETLKSLQEAHFTARTESKVEIALLKVKSSIWGTLGGSLTVGLYLFYEWITNQVKS